MRPDNDVTSCVVMFQPLDVIELRVAVDSWEAGTVATVLEVADGSLLAEVADEHGRTLEVLTVPVEAVSAVSAEDVPRRLRTSQDVPSARPCKSSSPLAFWGFTGNHCSSPRTQRDVLGGRLAVSNRCVQCLSL